MYRLLFLALLTFVPHHGDGAVIEARKWSNQGLCGVIKGEHVCMLNEQGWRSVVNNGMCHWSLWMPCNNGMCSHDSAPCWINEERQETLCT
ncbi:hypothetical protein ACCO45_010571 [Purpureocillium lilacinum]|uniref:Uncharacterized protein n=1 Tax=Purpureocillium lilacinum TaxID=33203 RepID=A0ACC4DG58_PURLI